MERYDDLLGPVLRPYIAVSYMKKYSDLRGKNARLLSSYTKAVYGRGDIRS